MSDLLAARLQMAWSLGFHIVFAAIGVALPVMMVIAEWRWQRTRDPVFLELAKRWAKGSAILFAVGAVSGTALSFELGLLWPRFMALAGPLIGVPFSLEGLGFFTEAIFLGVYLYGWERISPRMHLIAGAAVAISAAALLPAGPGARAIPSFVQVFVAPWLALSPMVVGILALALFAFLAAIYLTLAAPTAELRHDFRRYAYGAAVVAFGAALGGLLLAPGEAPRLGAGLASTAAALALRAAIAVAGLAALLALRSEWWRAARIAAAALASLILWDWALAQYPYLVPFTLTIRDAAAPRITLQLLLGGLAGGSLLVIPALAYLFRTFSISRKRSFANRVAE
jgi:hypothetical protein